MSWNSKMDVLALLIIIVGFPLIALVAGVFVPIIVDIKQGDFGWIAAIVILLAIIGCAIYFLIPRYYKNSSLKEEQK